MFKDSARTKDLVIHVDTGAVIGSKSLPLIYGCPEELTLLQATVSFETSQGCKAKGVEITFKAMVRTSYNAANDITLRLGAEEVFLFKKWDLQVEFSKPGWIEKGSYSRIVSVALDPTFPSSCSHYNGWVKYEFEARLKEGKGYGIVRTDIVTSKEVWVQNSQIPAMGLTNVPVRVERRWKDSVLLVVTVPSKILCFAQFVPVNIQLKPFVHGTEHEGQEVIISNMNFKLQETRTSRALYTKEVHQGIDRFVNLSVSTGWPRNVDGWERTIFISVPSSPMVSSSMTTRYLDVKHSLIVTMEFRTSKVKTSERIQAEVEVEITSQSKAMDPPEYGDTGDMGERGDTVQSIDAHLGIPVNLVDELPGYARYET